MEKIDYKAPSDNNLIHRAFSPTPRFWRKVRSVMIAIGALSGSMIADGDDLPLIVVEVAKYCVVVGVLGTILSQLTKK